MYSISVDGQALYSPLQIDTLCVLNPKLTLELNKAGSLEFTLPPSNQNYDNIQKLKSIVTVYQDGVEIFRGRVLHDEKDFYRRKAVYCEGELAFLLDSIMRPYSFTGDIPDFYWRLIHNHNSQVDSEKEFIVGEITVTDSNNYINRSNTGYSNTLDELKDKLLDTHGGYLKIRPKGGYHYLDYLAEPGEVSTQTIQFGVNMLDLTEYISADDVFTVLIPLGEEQKDEEGNVTGRLTIKDVNEGEDYITDETAVALFGKIWRTEEWDDVTVASNLLAKGKAYLKAGIEMSVTLTLKAVDLHLLNVDTERIKLGDSVRVVSLPHGLDKYFTCSKVVLDLVNPDRSEYTFGATYTTMTEKQITGTRKLQNTVALVQNATQAAQTSANQAAIAVSQVKTNISDDYVDSDTLAESMTAFKESIGETYVSKESYDELLDRIAVLESAMKEKSDTEVSEEDAATETENVEDSSTEES